MRYSWTPLSVCMRTVRERGREASLLLKKQGPVREEGKSSCCSGRGQKRETERRREREAERERLNIKVQAERTDRSVRVSVRGKNIVSTN